MRETQAGIVGKCNPPLQGSLIDVLSTYHWGRTVIGILHVKSKSPTTGSRYVRALGEYLGSHMFALLSYRLISLNPSLRTSSNPTPRHSSLPRGHACHIQYTRPPAIKFHVTCIIRHVRVHDKLDHVEPWSPRCHAGPAILAGVRRNRDWRGW